MRARAQAEAKKVRTMKTKISRGSGFRGALEYVFGKPKAAGLIGGTMSGVDPHALAREFEVVRRLRPDIARPVWHGVLALPLGERLDVDCWEAVVTDFMVRMDFAQNVPWVAVRHSDTDYDHVHILASRIALSGAVWGGQWEVRRAIAAVEELEAAHGLRITPTLADARAEEQNLRRRATKAEVERSERTGEAPPRQILQLVLDEVLDSAGDEGLTATEFAERLAEAGVECRANIASTGRMFGFSFAWNGVAFRASQMGKGYAWSVLQKKGDYGES